MLSNCRVAHGLSVAVCQTKDGTWVGAEEDNSGFSPFADDRIAGFRALFLNRVCDRFQCYGGLETLFGDGSKSRPEVICEILEREGVDPQWLSYTVTGPNTLGNVEGIAREVMGEDLADHRVVSSHFHLWRTARNLCAVDLDSMLLLPTEVILCLCAENPTALTEAWRDSHGHGPEVEEYFETIVLMASRVKRDGHLPTAATYPQPENYLEIIRGDGGEAKLWALLKGTPLGQRIWSEVRGCHHIEIGQYQAGL